MDLVLDTACSTRLCVLDRASQRASERKRASVAHEPLVDLRRSSSRAPLARQEEQAARPALHLALLARPRYLTASRCAALTWRANRRNTSAPKSHSSLSPRSASHSMRTRCAAHVTSSSCTRCATAIDASAVRRIVRGRRTSAGGSSAAGVGACSIVAERRLAVRVGPDLEERRREMVEDEEEDVVVESVRHGCERARARQRWSHCSARDRTHRVRRRGWRTDEEGERERGERRTSGLPDLHGESGEGASACLAFCELNNSREV